MTGRPRKLTEEDIAALAAEVKAPESLHRRIEAMLAPESLQADRGDGGSRPSLGRRTHRFPALGPLVGFAAVAALASIAVVVALGLSPGARQRSSSGLGVQQAAVLALSAATGPAPAENAGDRSQLRLAVDGVPFPYWKESFGWRGVGRRSDVVSGRDVTTVFYANGEGRRIGYAIAAGPAPRISGGTVVHRWGVSYRVLGHGGATIVTWQRKGHLCVIAGRGVSAHTLLKLASWGSEKPHAA